MHHWSKSHTSYGHAPMSSIHTCINTCTTGLKHIGRINMHYGSHPHTVNTSHITNRTPHTAIIYKDTISHTIWYSSQEQPQALAVQYSFLSIQTTWSQRIDNIKTLTHTIDSEAIPYLSHKNVHGFSPHCRLALSKSHETPNLSTTHRLAYQQISIVKSTTPPGHSASPPTRIFSIHHNHETIIFIYMHPRSSQNPPRLTHNLTSFLCTYLHRPQHIITTQKRENWFRHPHVSLDPSQWQH